MSRWPVVAEQLDVMVNQWYETPEIRRMLTVPLTPTRLAFRHLHMTFFGNNRRDCWAAVSCKAPLDVKRAIWEHEKDELIYDKRMGSAHLTDQQMAEATAESNLLPGARTAIYAWMYLATTRPWIESLMVNHITERKNNSAIVKGG